MIFLSCGPRGKFSCSFIAKKIYSNVIIMLSFHLNQMFLLNLILREMKIQTVYICRSIEFLTLGHKRICGEMFHIEISDSRLQTLESW